MSNISCNVIRDLLPLYADDVVSAESKLLVEGHLSECPGCAEELSRLRKPIAVPCETEASPLKRIRKRILHEKIAVSAISVVLSLAVLASCLWWSFTCRLVIPYSDDLLEAGYSDADGVLEILYLGSNYSYVHAVNRTEEVDGDQKNVVYICYYNNLVTKFVDGRSFEHDPFVFGNGLMVDYGHSAEAVPCATDVDLIYYQNAKPAKLGDRAVDRYLVWQKDQ